MSSPTIMLRFFATLISVLICQSAIAAKPNILFIFTDDQRADAVGLLGNPNVKTPNMDRLISRGTLFTQAYIQGSMTNGTCLPSRAMIMSGKSLFRASMTLDTGLLLPQAFQKSGYTTFATGKWHNGSESFIKCFNQGEAVMLGAFARAHDNVPLNRLENGGMTPYERPGVFASEVFADAAIKFLTSRKDQEDPFFCYIPFTAPHSPYTPPADYASMYDPKKITLPPNHAALLPQDGQRAPRGRGGNSLDASRQTYADYYGLISHLDFHIGRVIQSLEDMGLAENTIILFATDHGLSLQSHGQRGKANAYEHSSRSLISFSGPGLPQGARTPALAYLLDIYPTLCQLAGVDATNDLDGRSLANIIHKKDSKVRDFLFTAYMENERTIRDNQFKLFARLGEGPTELFDLQNDPHELHDLSANPEHSDRIVKLQSELELARIFYNDTPQRVSQLVRRRGGGRGGFRR
jgi:arylsulfatase A-like enzyme